jgi:hypothetical protein
MGEAIHWAGTAFMLAGDRMIGLGIVIAQKHNIAKKECFQASTAASGAASGVWGGGGFAGGAPTGNRVRVQSGMTFVGHTATSLSSMESSGPR